MRVALFVTCVGDLMFPQAPRATVHLLERLGHEVIFPESQGCCGQMHISTGYFPEVAPPIKNRVKTFEPVLDGEWDAIVVPLGSCTGSLRHQPKMVAKFEGMPGMAKRASQTTKKTYDLSKLLVDVLGLTNAGTYLPHRVAYHPTCHSMRIARVGDHPYQLLRAVEGITLVNLPEAEPCYGFGGTFSMKNHQTSTAMLADRMANVKPTKAEILTAGDYSCLMHIAGGFSHQRAGIHAVRPAEILADTKGQSWEADEMATKLGT